MVVDELHDLGLERMDDEEIRGFLSSQKVGVLAFPDRESPYLLPMSYGFDDDVTLYFTFLVGSTSRKKELIEQAEYVSFLVYRVDSMFSWESVLLQGTLKEIPETEWDTLDAETTSAWRPEILRQAQSSGEVVLYGFQIAAQSGIRHTGLPPGFERQSE
ncbi:pyridoxamine 5'-phosphate oxidase family protein [Haloarcula sp. Atlit-7R]|uniref:pyridoxamine 5'-phosphate oxidase family protein n=1 Tax=Haloarcula sp. Atlit-7R TaxID=2282125 RepID=UPI000EF154CB|nr:pyridoxamine 5'-phosphate oxidase family protein [Haloarcula sp. Atlit-7R]RLM88433.1 pyridoxamine 5'-phosphate oxidase family protein [Haloarcula sp. Atlit-7R]